MYTQSAFTQNIYTKIYFISYSCLAIYFYLGFFFVAHAGNRQFLVHSFTMILSIKSFKFIEFVFLIVQIKRKTIPKIDKNTHQTISIENSREI